MLIQSVINGIPESLQKEASREREKKQQSAPLQVQRDASVPKEIFQGGNSTENLWLDLWLENGLRFHFDSKTCLN